MNAKLGMSAARTHFVYRMYDAEERLLYVGCTKDIVRRLRNHRSDNKHFFNRVARIAQQGPYPQAIALRLEKHLIEELRPDFNSSPDRLRRVAEKRAWTDARTLELCGGRSPRQMEYTEYLRLSSIACSEAASLFPGIVDSRRPHPCEVSA